MSDDLIAFVRARLDERERVAQGAAVDQGAKWKAFEGTYGWAVATESGGIIRDGDSGGAQAVAEHIAHWNPACALAEVEAKRRILDALAERLDADCEDGGWEAADAETDGMATTTLRLLALPFAGHPDYREEWRP